MACAFYALPALAGSQARIVRLSDVQGSVQIDKNTGLGFENAFLNLPVMQGAQLRTRGNGRVENVAVAKGVMQLSSAGAR